MAGIYETESKFQEEKKRILGRADLSKIGSVDKEIKPIVDAINAKPDYCTTSSCAGRITLLERRSNRKDQSNWLLSSHSNITSNDLQSNLKSDYDVWLMQESFIIHVFCRDLESAKKLLSLCRELGLKHAGIVSITKKIMVEAIGNEKIEAMVIKSGKPLVDAEYLKVITDECNKRMDKNRKKLGELLSKLKHL